MPEQRTGNQIAEEIDKNEQIIWELERAINKLIDEKPLNNYVMDILSPDLEFRKRMKNILMKRIYITQD